MKLHTADIFGQSGGRAVDYDPDNFRRDVRSVTARQQWANGCTEHYTEVVFANGEVAKVAEAPQVIRAMFYDTSWSDVDPTAGLDRKFNWGGDP